MLRTTSSWFFAFFDEDLSEIYLKFVANAKMIRRSSSSSFGLSMASE